MRTVSGYYASKQETESRFDQILAEIRQDRLEQSNKWEEQNRKWDETQQQLQRMQEQIDQTLVEIKRLDSRGDGGL